MYYKLVSIFVLLAIVFVLPSVALADKPDNKHQPEADHGTGGPDDSASDNNPSDSDAHNNDDSHSNGPNRPEAPGNAGEHANCDNNGFDCGDTPNEPDSPDAPESTPNNPVSTPEAELTPTPDNTPIPVAESTPEANVTEDAPITTTNVVPLVFPETGNACEDCDVCDKLDTIIAQNQEILANQQTMINLLSKLVNFLIGNK